MSEARGGQPRAWSGRLAGMRTVLVALGVMLAGTALGQSWLPQAGPPLPRERPDAEAPAAEAAAAEAAAEAPEDAAVPDAEQAVVPLPRPRPEPEPEEPAEEDADDGETDGEDVAAEPEEPRIYQSACPAVLAGRVVAEALPPISEGQCIAQSPLALSGVLVGGRTIAVTGGATTSCVVATVLPQWAEAIDGYLWARENARLTRIVVGTSYMCRPRNNAAGADLSEHGFAGALDVIGFTLDDGRTVTVEAGWSDAASSEGRLLRFAHDSACALFTTTLGPEANAQHRDHFHVDLGCHGGTCTARLCE